MTDSRLEEWAALTGRVALITGAAGGLGRGIAMALNEVGMRLVVCDSDAAGLERLTDDLSRAGRAPVAAAAFDVRDADALTAFFAEVDRHVSSPDVLVNVVGGTFHSPFLATRSRGWEALVDVNLTQLLRCSQLAASRMVTAGVRGSIISITSIEGHRAAPGYAVYAGLKSAVEGFSRSLAVELGPLGIRVNCVAPDYVVTEGTTALERSLGAEPVSEDEACMTTPLGRLGTVQDVAGSVAFLASGLSGFITGATLHPDGGALVAGRWVRSGSGWTLRQEPSRWQ